MQVRADAILELVCISQQPLGTLCFEEAMLTSLLSNRAQCEMTKLSLGQECTLLMDVALPWLLIAASRFDACKRDLYSAAMTFSGSADLHARTDLH